MKYVIARGEGPKGTTNGRLVPGHKYEVLYISYPSSLERFEMKDNPKEAKFYIRIKDDTGINSWSMWYTGEYTYWNDYFLSTEEMREMKLEEILY